MGELNIYQRMSAVTNEIRRVAKNLNVGVGQSQYKAVGEADVLDTVKPLEEKYGIYSYPAKRIIVSSDLLESESLDKYTKEKKTKTQQFMRVETIYKFVNVDKPDEFIETTTYGDGVDSQDKAPGKAMTYGDKYALLKAYKIATGDDPDQNASEELTKPNKTTQQPKQQPQVQKVSPKEIDADVEALKQEKIDKIKIATLEAEIARTGSSKTNMLKKYKVAAIEDFTLTQYADLMKIFEKVKTKVKTDLGL